MAGRTSCALQLVLSDSQAQSLDQQLPPIPLNPFLKSVDSAPLDDELFDGPQASLTAVPLHEAFSWAYAHFILEDEVPIPQPEGPSEPRSLTRQVLRYAAAAA